MATITINVNENDVIDGSGGGSADDYANMLREECASDFPGAKVTININRNVSGASREPVYEDSDATAADESAKQNALIHTVQAAWERFTRSVG